MRHNWEEVCWPSSLETNQSRNPLQVLNIPVLPGEASRLMKAWTRVRYHAGEIKHNIVHPLHRFGWTMASGLDRSPETQGVDLAVNNGATMQPSSRMSDAQSDVEFMEAVYDSGPFRVTHAPVYTTYAQAVLITFPPNTALDTKLEQKSTTLMTCVGQHTFKHGRPWYDCLLQPTAGQAHTSLAEVEVAIPCLHTLEHEHVPCAISLADAHLLLFVLCGFCC